MILLVQQKANCADQHVHEPDSNQDACQNSSSTR